jgi:hypothetical protein
MQYELQLMVNEFTGIVPRQHELRYLPVKANSFTAPLAAFVTNR